MNSYETIQSVRSIGSVLTAMNYSLLNKCFDLLLSLSSDESTEDIALSKVLNPYDLNKLTFEPFSFDLRHKNLEIYTAKVSAISIVPISYESFDRERVFTDKVDFRLHKDKVSTPYMSVSLICSEDDEDYWKIWRSCIDADSGRSSVIDYNWDCRGSDE